MRSRAPGRRRHTSLRVPEFLSWLGKADLRIGRALTRIWVVWGEPGPCSHDFDRFVCRPILAGLPPISGELGHLWRDTFVTAPIRCCSLAAHVQLTCQSCAAHAQLTCRACDAHVLLARRSFVRVPLPRQRSDRNSERGRMHVQRCVSGALARAGRPPERVFSVSCPCCRASTLTLRPLSGVCVCVCVRWGANSMRAPREGYWDAELPIPRHL